MKQTAESVSNCHPDKVADIVADAIVDAYLSQDKEAILGVKTLISRDLVVVSGEIGSPVTVDLEQVVRDTLVGLGFDGAREKWDATKTEIRLAYNDVSHELDDPTLLTIHERGAADQCLVVGYATKETATLFPVAAYLSRALIDKVGAVRSSIEGLRGDAKSLVTVEYKEGMPRIDSVVLSTEHAPDSDVSDIRKELEDQVVGGLLGNLIDGNTQIYINPLGPFTDAGPYAETGLSGRKIVVDQYGDSAPVGGGALSGKDPSKLDRAGAYMARHIAKSIVGNGFASECTVKTSYAIGVSDPVNVQVDAKGSCYSSDELVALVRHNFSLKPRGIVNELGLLDIKYAEVTKRGHFHPSLPWEQVRPLEVPHD